MRTELWTDLECAAGHRKAVLAPLPGSVDVQTLDASARCELRLAADAATLALVEVGDVVRVVDNRPEEAEANWEIREWRISEIEDVSGQGQEELTVRGVLPILDLTDAGLIRLTTSGGGTSHNLGGVDTRPGVYVDTYILANLADDGLDWLERGTIAPTDKLSLAWDRWPRQQLVTELAKQTTSEFRLRRHGATGYYLDVLAAGGIGSGSATPLFRVGRGVLQLHRTRSAVTDYATALVPAGVVVDGALEAAGIEYAAWEIAAIATDTPTAGQDSLQLADPAGEDPPFTWDDQLPDTYLLTPTGTLLEVLDTVAGASQYAVVAAGHGLVVGDHVQFCADSSGTRLTMLSDPTATRRVVRSLELTGRGERNHTPNAYLKAWPTKPLTLIGTAAGANSATQVLTVPTSAIGLVVPAGSLFYTGTANAYSLTGSATVAGDATLTCVLDSVANTVAGQVIYVWPMRPPTGWTIPAAGSGGGTMLVFDRSATVPTSAVVDGVHSNTIPLHLRGLTEGDTIRPGDKITIGAAVRWSHGQVTVGASGKVDVPISLTAGVTAADGDPVTITKLASLAPEGGTVIAALPLDAGYIESPAYTIRRDVTTPRAWAKVWFTLIGPAGTLKQDGTGTYIPPLVSVINAGTGATLASAYDQDRTLTEGVPVDVEMAIPYDLTATTAIKIRIRSLMRPVRASWGAPFVIPRCVMLALGTDSTVPAILGAHANAQWRQTSRKLAAISQVPATFAMTVLDLSRIAGYDPTAERIVLGGYGLVIDERMVVEEELRIIEIATPLHEGAQASDTRLTLGAGSARFSAMVGARTTPRVTIQVNVGTGEAPDVRNVGTQLPSTDLAQPPRQRDGLRIQPNPEIQDENSGVVNPTPYTPGIE